MRDARDHQASRKDVATVKATMDAPGPQYVGQHVRCTRDRSHAVATDGGYRLGLCRIRGVSEECAGRSR